MKVLKKNYYLNLYLLVILCSIWMISIFSFDHGTSISYQSRSQSLKPLQFIDNESKIEDKILIPSSKSNEKLNYNIRIASFHELPSIIKLRVHVFYPQVS